MNGMSREQILASIEPKSDQWNFDDLAAGPRTFTVAGVSAGSSDQPVQIRLKGEERYFRPCKSMRRVLVFAWGDDGHQWVGRSLTLVGDPSVKFGGVAVGGIRISHLSHIDGPQTLQLTVTRSKRAPYKVLPLKSEPAPTPPVSPGADSRESEPPSSPGGSYAVDNIGMSPYEWVKAVTKKLDDAEDPYEAWLANQDVFTSLMQKATTEAGKAALDALQDYAKARIEHQNQADLLAAG